MGQNGRHLVAENATKINEKQIIFSATEQCDWPEQSLCQFDPNAVQAKALNEKTFLYLTFDDGPNEGTEFVLDALADSNVPATFFINR